MLRKIKILVVIILLCKLQALAQQTGTPAKQEQKTIKLFFEKSYLHTDRGYYSTGETIWFASYLVNGKSSNLTQTSNNLYVELLSPTSTVLDRKLIRLDGGLGKGDFKLKDSLPSGWYQVRAYTNWMRNFNDDFIFKKKIYIKNTTGIKDAVPATISSRNKVLNFFPEGGSLVEGLNSIIAFKANDSQGNGTIVNGSIISAKGDTITSFQSTDVGLGMFAFTPQPGEKYSVAGNFGKEPFKTQLPNILVKGLSLHVTVDSLNIKAMITANAAIFGEVQNKPLTIAIKHAGDVVYSGTINLTQPNASVAISTKDLPQGIAVLTIFDHLGRPNCERLIYIQPSNLINFSITPSKAIYSTREQVSLQIKTTNALGTPVKTSFSIAAVDGLIPEDGSNITAYLLLQSELKGEIKDPSQYFDPKNASRFKQLNLLLLTQGWRDYIWKKIADSAIKISFLPEPGITIKGLVREKLNEKPMPGMNITLFGSNFIGNTLFLTQTDKDGKYYLDGLNWFGNQAIKISSQDAKAKKGGWLQIDTSFKTPPIGTVRGAESIFPAPAFDELSKRMAYNRTYKTGDEINLDEVKVVAGKNGRVEMFDQTLSTFGYEDQVFNITAADYSYKGLEHFLLTKVKGAVSLDIPSNDSTSQDSLSDEGIAFFANGKKIRPRIMVNNREDLQQRLDYYSLTMDQINQIVVRHLVGNQGQDVYVLSLNLKDSALRGPNLHLLNINLNGYYQAREFYSPNYSTTSPSVKDLRTTIFWAPLLSTNDAGEANVTFYNGDNKAPIMIKAEGITAQGTAVSSKTTYKVQ